MNTQQLENFYRRWLTVNHYIEPPIENPVPAPIQDANNLQNIVFENNKFQLYVEKGKYGSLLKINFE